jgi:hypothetical protein
LPGHPGPIVVGYRKDATGGFEAGMYVLMLSSPVSTPTALGCVVWLKAPRTARAGLAIG